MFSGKCVFITGAAAGLGFAVARKFAEAGAYVAMADINGEAVQAAAVKLQKSGSKILALQCDVTDIKSVEQILAEVAERFGGVDIAYNNAGVQGQIMKLADVEPTDFCRIVGVNLGGVFNCMKHELKLMRQQKNGGCIINCSSQSGIVGSAGTAVYTAAKHGVIGLTKCAALEYIGQNIRINAICPGAIRTNMVAQAISSSPEIEKELLRNIPAGRMAEPEEIAGLVLWLASAESSFVVGQAIVADGGYTIK